MSSWNELYSERRHVQQAPESGVYAFCYAVEASFPNERLLFWDHGCGAGRHSLALASRGHRAFGSDNAPAGIAAAEKRSRDSGLNTAFSVADMTICPWPDMFHGVVSWNVLNHGTLDQIRLAVNTIYDRLLARGLLLATFKSVYADRFGKGQELERNTFRLTVGDEAGTVHHASYVAVELDVIQVRLRRLDFERGFFVKIPQLENLGMTE